MTFHIIKLLTTCIRTKEPTWYGSEETRHLNCDTSFQIYMSVLVSALGRTVERDTKLLFDFSP